MNDGNTFDLAACRDAPLEWTHPNNRGRGLHIPPEMAALCASCPCYTPCENKAKLIIARGDQIIGVWAGVAYGDDKTNRLRQQRNLN